MRIMKILVTGANGYLGQGIVKKLIDFGHEVIAADGAIDLVDKRANKKVCDIFSIENPFEYFEQPNILLHLAWRDGFKHYSDSHINDLPKHYAFIKTFSRTDIKKIAVMGSMHEIGFFEGAITSDTPCNPTTPYGIAKNALRELTATLCQQHRKEFLWLRGFYIVGNSQYGSSIFSKITLAENRGEKEFPFTRGQNQFDFIDYEIFCKQVASAVTQDEFLGILNVCSGYPEKLSDRVERFLCENNYKIKLRYGAFPDRPYDSKAVWGDASKINEVMNKSRTSL